MTKAEVMKTVEIVVSSYGLKFEDKGNHFEIKFPVENNENSWADFTVLDCTDTNIDLANRTYTASVEIRAGIRRMSGSMTTEELFEASQQLLKAATVMSVFDNMDLSYTESID